MCRWRIGISGMNWHTLCQWREVYTLPQMSPPCWQRQNKSEWVRESGGRRGERGRREGKGESEREREIEREREYTLNPPAYIHPTYRYPAYTIYSDNSISNLASRTSTRYSLNSLFGVLFDITILSECDYIVCTFSSQVSSTCLLLTTCVYHPSCGTHHCTHSVCACVCVQVTSWCGM